MSTHHYTRRDFFRAIGLGTVSLALPGCTSSSEQVTGKTEMPPNIIFILADDLGWADVGYHDSDIMTPNLDRLAKEGVRLQQHYVQPMCTPTRVALLTGRYPSRYGNHAVKPCNEQVLDFGTVTLASALKTIGYDTGITGKWHLGSKTEWGPLKYGSQAGNLQANIPALTKSVRSLAATSHIVDTRRSFTKAVSACRHL